MRVLFLDDLRDPSDPYPTLYGFPLSDFVVVRGWSEFVYEIETNGVPDFVSFDHDLCPEHYSASLEESETGIQPNYGEIKTGFDCARWLVAYCQNGKLQFPDYAIHSFNEAGGARIRNYIELWKRTRFI